MQTSNSALRLLSALVISTSLLSGCMSSTEKVAPPVTNVPKVEEKVEPIITAEEGLSDDERLSKAIKNLELGNSEIAKVELEAYLSSTPRSKIAKQLLHQIKTPVEQLYPDAFFEVDIEYGESLSTLSEKYLGSSLAFYSLALYNDIDQPQRVIVGQTIKIPKTESSARIRDQVLKQKDADSQDVVPESEIADETVVDTAEETEETIEKIEETPEESPQPEALTSEQIAQLIEQLNEQQNFIESYDKLTYLDSIGEGDVLSEALRLNTLAGYADQIKALHPEEASNIFENLADIYANNGDEIQQYLMLEKAVQISDASDISASELESKKQELVEKYHRNASSHFRKQELDLAIQSWDAVLAIAPEHANAQASKEKAIALKQKMEELSQ